MHTDSKRQLQVGSTIKREMSEILQHEGIYIYGAKPLVTVTNVKLTSDLGLAKVYISVWNTEEKLQIVDMLQAEQVRLRQALAARLRNKMRRCPDITFYEDETLDEMYKLRDVFSDLHSTDQMGDGKTIEDYKLDEYEEEIE
jgi:ribosome-binding factor A